jgi:putative spermidine/putrescine transport system ATP-binding protein
VTDVRIRIDKVSKAFGSLTVFDKLSLEITKGEFISLLGPSGSGKTTLLMMLAGFEKPSGGTILLDGEPIDDLPAYKRNMGVVFQNYALFPHMTVAENVAFPLKMRGISKAQRDANVATALDMVQLRHLRDRRPSQLSGGQQQRIALARALVFEPRVVLMDEPLGALDKQLREQMQLDIRALHQRLELTIVFVTHDQSEALTMSDRIAVLNEARIEQIGTPKEIYDQPSTRFVAEFVGETNLMDGVVEAAGEKGLRVCLRGGSVITVSPWATARPGQRIFVSLRPERIELNSEGPSSNTIAATVKDCIFKGDHVRVHLNRDSEDYIARLNRRSAEWQSGCQVVASFTPSDCWVIPQ